MNVVASRFLVNGMLVEIYVNGGSMEIGNKQICVTDGRLIDFYMNVRTNERVSIKKKLFQID